MGGCGGKEDTGSQAEVHAPNPTSQRDMNATESHVDATAESHMDALDRHHLPDILLKIGVQPVARVASLACRAFNDACSEETGANRPWVL